MIFGDPTDNELLSGHKGILEYEIHFKGKKAHSSNPDKGIIANNSVSAHCKINIDFRIAIASHIYKLYKRVQELCEKYNSSYNIIELVEPFIDKIDFLPEIKTANFLTEASKITGSKRIILGTGPVTAHEVNEHISTESYDKLVEQYKELILKICK